MTDTYENGKDCIITPPKGFVPPEGTDKGKSFDLVCTFEPVEGGKLKMTMLGDSPMKSDDDKDEPTPASKPDYSEYARGMMGGMVGMGGEQSGQMG